MVYQSENKKVGPLGGDTSKAAGILALSALAILVLLNRGLRGIGVTASVKAG